MPEVVRCAVYTRKSTEDGLEQDFNSLDAQFEACAAYIASQKAEGWVLSSGRYDDGGLSGGTLERPALKRLLADIEAGKIDRIVVYKIDRLTRSLSDFAKIVDQLDAVDASFVSVTQSFNTATSMGRLTLNMLLSFAQFEREVTAERIRDKIAASKRKGLWMGGSIPFGYLPDGRTLSIDKTEAPIIRQIYEMYAELGSVRAVTEQAEALGFKTRLTTLSDGRTKGGKAFTRGHIYQILTNPIYAGRIRHKEQVFEGQHEAIIDPPHWEEVQQRLKDQAARERTVGNGRHSSPLASKLFDDTDDKLTPSHTSKNGKRIRYYISRRLVTGIKKNNADAWRLPASALEDGIGQIIARHISKPSFLMELVKDIAAGEVETMTAKLSDIAARMNKPNNAFAWARVLRRADLQQGKITLRLCRKALAAALDMPVDRIDNQARTFSAPFQHRKRGVETKIILGEVKPSRDMVLIKNIYTAQKWYAALRHGQTLKQIADDNGIRQSRIRQMIGLAFLAPDILQTVLDGSQPMNFTSQWVKHNPIPSDWKKQRNVIVAL